MESLEQFIKHYAGKINSLDRHEDRYIVVKGGNSYLRERFVIGLQSQVHIQVYGEEQFPNSEGKLVIDLNDVFSC